MGCYCFTANSFKAEEAASEKEIDSAALNLPSHHRRLFTVREENHETTESRSLSPLE